MQDTTTTIIGMHIKYLWLTLLVCDGFNIDTSRPFAGFKGPTSSYFGFSTRFYGHGEDKW